MPSECAPFRWMLRGLQGWERLEAWKRGKARNGDDEPSRNKVEIATPTTAKTERVAKTNAERHATAWI